MLQPSQLIAFYLTLIPTVFHNSKFKSLSHPPLLAYIYTPPLGLKVKSKLVFSRADEVPVIGMQNIYSNAKLILMLKKDCLYLTR